MKTVIGDYGKVRMMSEISLPLEKEVLNYIAPACGWHECNQTYKICRENGIPHYLLLFTIGGEGKLNIDGQSFTLTKNSVCIIPPFVKNEYFTAKNKLWEFYWIHCDGIFAKSALNSIVKTAGYCFSVKDISVFSTFAENILKEKGYPNFAFTVSKILSEIFYRLLFETIFKAESTDTTVLSVMSQIKENLNQPVNISQIAKKNFMSTNNLIRIFKAKAGLTPYQYINKYRITAASELLISTNLQVNEIANIVGFNSVSNFIATFKETKNLTPKQFRKNFFNS